MQAAQLATPRSTEVETNTQSEKAWRVALVVVCLALLTNLIVLFWGLNRGLDTDVESFYLVQYQNPSIYPTFSSFHLLLSKIPKLVSSEILHYRLLEIAARLIPALLLSLGFATWANRWLQLSNVKRALLATSAVLGATIVFCCFPRTISYNGLSSALLTLSVACAFFASSGVGSARVQRFGKPLLLALAGICIALNFFVKFTSAVVLLPVLLVFLLVQRCTWRDCSAVIVGGVGGLVFFFTLVQGMGDWWTAFSEATKFELLTDHSPAGMTAGALEFIGRHWWQGLVLLGITFCLNRSMATLSGEKQRTLVRLLCGAFSALLLLTTCVLLAKSNLVKGRESVVTIATLSFFAVLLSTSRPKNWRFLIGAVLLLLLPLIAALGTNCNFLSHASSNMAPWFLLIMVGSFICADRFKAPYAMAAVPAAFALFSVTQFYSQYVYQRDDGLVLPRQSAETSKIPLLLGMKLEEKDIQFYEHAHKILFGNGFRPGDYILSLYDFPAIVYLMQGVSPGQSWYISWPERDEINAHYIRKAKLAEGQRVFVVLSGVDPKKIVLPKMQEALHDPNVALAKSFKRIGVLPHPRNADFKVYFYAANTAQN